MEGAQRSRKQLMKTFSRFLKGVFHFSREAETASPSGSVSGFDSKIDAHERPYPTADQVTKNRKSPPGPPGSTQLTLTNISLTVHFLR